MPSNIIAGLDIGSTKTCAVIAELGTDAARRPVVKVLGVGQARTGGIRREVVTDLEGTTDSVRRAMKEAELMAGARADRVFVGIAGEHIAARTSTGVVAVGGGEIGPADVRRVHEIARAVVLAVGRDWTRAYAEAQTALAERRMAEMLAAGAQVIELDAAERRRWAETIPNVAKGWAKDLDAKGLPGTTVLEAYMRAQREAGVPILRDWSAA